MNFTLKTDEFVGNKAVARNFGILKRGQKLLVNQNCEQ